MRVDARPFSPFLLPSETPPPHHSRTLSPGSAIHSRELEGGERIVSIDGQEVTPENFKCLLKGCDMPGNIATLTIIKREARGGSGGGEGEKSTATSFSGGFRFVTDITGDRRGEWEGGTQMVDVKLRGLNQSEMIDNVSFVCVCGYLCLCPRP